MYSQIHFRKLLAVIYHRKKSYIKNKKVKSSKFNFEQFHIYNMEQPLDSDKVH